MKNVVLTLILAFALANIGFAAEKKLAQTGFQFLSVPTEARASAMGEAFTTIAGNSSSIFYNPANLARTNSFMDAAISRNDWIADITYTAGSIAFNPFRGNYGTVGISVLSVDYGEFLGTVVDPTTEKGFMDTGTFAPSNFSVGLGYAKALTDRFSVGGQVKYVNQELGQSTLPVGEAAEGITTTVDNKVDVIAFDFGTVYKTGFKSFVFGMSVRNFSQEIKYQNEGFQLPLTFSIGASMNVMDFFEGLGNMHSLLVSIDALHPRSYSERLNIGVEYIFAGILALRAGYLYNYDERDITAGFGVQKEFGNRNIAIDYAYTPFGVFDHVQRMTFRFAL